MEPQERKKFDSQQVMDAILGYLPYWRFMLIAFALGLLAGIGYYIFATPTFLARSMVDLKVFSSPVEAGNVKEDTSTPSHLLRRSLITELTSRHLVLKAAQSLGLASDNTSYENVQEDHVPKLQIELLDVNHLQVTVYAYSPRVVREFGSALISEYRKYQSEIRNNYRAEAAERYRGELEEIQKRIGESSRNLSDYEREGNVAQLFIEANKLTEVPKKLVLLKDRLTKMGEIKGRLNTPANTGQIIEQLSILNAFDKGAQVEVGNLIRSEDPKKKGPLENEAGGADAKIVVQPAMVEGIEPWMALEKTFRELSAQIAEMSKKFLPGHEQMIALNQDLAEVERKLRSEWDVKRKRFDLEEAQAKEDMTSLEAKLPEYHDITAKYEQFEREYVVRKQGQTVWDKAYQNLTEKLASIEHDLDKDRIELTHTGFVSLRDVDPVSPNKFKLFLVALIVGFGGAFGGASVLRFMDNTAQRLNDVERETGLLGLGIVPLTTKAVLEDVFRSPVIDAKLPNFFLENIRLIRANICLHPGRKSRTQVVMITSARPSEGKTSMAANLAWAFYSMGERTLLVDCDLRRGRVHHITGVDHSTGLSTLITGRSSEAQSVKSTQDGRLDVIPRGPIITGATELLIQGGFDKLVEQWRTEYDRIVLDCAPTLGLSDTAALQRVADGVAMVVRTERTQKKDIKDALETLQKAGAHVFGFIMNGVDLNKFRNSYHYYYYSPYYYAQLEADEDDFPQRGKVAS